MKCIASGLNPSLDLRDIWILSFFVCLKYREWMGRVWGISALLTRSSARAQQGAQRALPWTGHSKVFCTKKQGKKKLNYLHVHFPWIFVSENFTALKIET